MRSKKQLDFMNTEGMMRMAIAGTFGIDYATYATYATYAATATYAASAAAYASAYASAASSAATYAAASAASATYAARPIFDKLANKLLLPNCVAMEKIKYFSVREDE